MLIHSTDPLLISLLYHTVLYIYNILNILSFVVLFLEAAAVKQKGEREGNKEASE